MNRRNFLLKMFLGVPAAIGITRLLAACGRDDVSDITSYLGASCDSKTNGLNLTYKWPNSTGVAGTGHNHGLTIPLADVQVGATMSYTATGTTHPHTLVLTAEHFATLKAGQTIQVFCSYDNGHTHLLTISCLS